MTEPVNFAQFYIVKKSDETGDSAHGPYTMMEAESLLQPNERITTEQGLTKLRNPVRQQTADEKAIDYLKANFRPWLTIWIRPRATIRKIVDSNPAQQVTLLAMLAGISESLGRASNNDLGNSLPLAAIILIALVGGSIGGLITVYISGSFLRWTGSWFGGRASTDEVKAAIAWSSVPTIWGLLTWIPWFAFFGDEIFRNITPRMDNSPGLVLFLSFLELVLFIWAFVIFLKCLAEVHQFSVWRAFAASIAPGLILLVVVLSCSFLLTGSIG